MRNTDPVNPDRFNPFGPKVEPKKPATNVPPHTVPVGPYGIVTLPDGTIRTTRDNLPKYEQHWWDFPGTLP